MRVSFAAAALVALSAVPAASRAQGPNANYAIDVSRSTRDVKVGDKGAVSIVIVPGAGRKVHEQAPLVITLKAPAGVELSKGKLGHGDVANPGEASPELRVEFTAKEAGEGAVKADLTFFICTEKWCERQQEKVSVPVSVK